MIKVKEVFVKIVIIIGAVLLSIAKSLFSRSLYLGQGILLAMSVAIEAFIIAKLFSFTPSIMGNEVEITFKFLATFTVILFLAGSGARDIYKFIKGESE